MGSVSLFAAKKIVDLRLPTGKPGNAGAAAIGAYCERPNPDIVLLVSLPRLDRGAQSSPWFNALARLGAVVDVWPVDRSRLPAWIAERLARQNQRASREVLAFLAERVEGNLLAAHQELQKLALLAPQGEVSMQTVQEAVGSVARYDPYDAAQALLAADLGRYARVIDGLRAEGEQPTFVLFVLASALFALKEGNPERIFNRALRQAVEGAAQRFSARRVERSLVEAAAIDRAIKGIERQEPWEAFMRLGLNLAGGAKA
jgi:DNA polymerase-3 subunit delta